LTAKGLCVFIASTSSMLSPASSRAICAAGEGTFGSAPSRPARTRWRAGTPLRFPGLGAIFVEEWDEVLGQVSAKAKRDRWSLRSLGTTQRATSNGMTGSPSKADCITESWSSWCRRSSSMRPSRSSKSGSVPRKDEVQSQPAPPSQRVEVALQGPRGSAGPQADVWGDVEQQARFLPPLVASAK
jgi:hypothetical protein